MQGQYNLRSPAVKRLMREAHELREPTEQYFAQPLEDNLFEWHFTIRGPDDTDFSEGIYHGRIVLPPEYPMKPPSIIILTPNGRFEIHKKICLSISGHHPESWQPSWSIRTALLAIIGFMPSHGNGAIGSLDYTKDERKKLAKKSQEWQCSDCGGIRNRLLEVTEASKAVNEEAKELGAQINMQGEKDTSKSESSEDDKKTEEPAQVAPQAAAATPPAPPVTQPNPFAQGFNPNMFAGRFPMPGGGAGGNPFPLPPMFSMGQNPAARGQNAPRVPFWPPPFGMMPPGQMPRFPVWPGQQPGIPSMSTPSAENSPTTTSVTSSASTPTSMPASQSSSSASTSTASSSSQDQAGARPKTSAAATSLSTSTPTVPSSTTPASPPSPTTPAASSDVQSASSTTSQASTASTTPTATTTAATTTGLRQRNQSAAASPGGNVQVVRERAELPRNAQSQGFSISTCLLIIMGIILAFLIIRRLIMMDIIRFLDTV